MAFLSLNLIRILCLRKGGRKRGIFSNHEKENVVRRDLDRSAPVREAVELALGVARTASQTPAQGTEAPA